MISKLRKIMGNMSSKVGGPSRVKGSIRFIKFYIMHKF